MNPSATHTIPRRPLTASRSRPPTPDALDSLLDDYYHEPPPRYDSGSRAPPPLAPPQSFSPPNLSAPSYPFSPALRPAASTGNLRLDTRPAALERHLTIPVVDSPAQLTPVSPISTPALSTATSPLTPASDVAVAASSQPKSKFRSAIDETVFFAGGLVSHPFESNRHFSVLRHSPGLVYYRGPSTSVSITIFSDNPLPSDRSLWLQRRGFSGNMGMNASALFRSNSNWVDVTPSSEALPAELPEMDERAYQRDINKFLKKASKERGLKKQTARETCIVRIPHEAEDGYLRIVVCSGEGSKKSLCPSPIFRIASTSKDASVFRGASLSTMPLEVGVKVASTVAETYVRRVAAPAAMAATGAAGVVQSRVQKAQPSIMTRNPEKVIAVRTGLQQKLSEVEDRYRPTRGNQYVPLHCQQNPYDSAPEVVGSDDGPEEPFPLRFDGRVVPGTGQGRHETGIPTANLSGLPSDLLLRLGGIYIGWAAVQPRKGLVGVSHDWHEAIVTVGASPYAAPRVVPKKIGTVHLVHDFGGVDFLDTKLKVIMMGYLRPLPRPHGDRSIPRNPAEIAAAVAHDVAIAVASLSRETWAVGVTREQMKEVRRQRSFTDRGVEIRERVQVGVDNVPAHWIGVRTTGAALQDKAHGTGGLYIRR